MGEIGKEPRNVNFKILQVGEIKKSQKLLYENLVTSFFPCTFFSISIYIYVLRPEHKYPNFSTNRLNGIEMLI